MKGLVDIEVTIPNSKVVYRLSLDRKVSILSGGSGSGKSVLRDFIEVCNNDESGTLKRLISYKGCQGVYTVPFGIKDWRSHLEGIRESVIVLDEDNRSILRDGDFPRFVASSDNYFVIITRDILIGSISYSNGSIYEFKSEPYKGGTLNFLSPLFANRLVNVTPDVVVIENSVPGYMFFKNTLKCDVISEGSRTRMLKRVRSLCRSKKYRVIYVIADGENFGYETLLFKEFINSKEYADSGVSITLFTPRSFEYYY